MSDFKKKATTMGIAMALGAPWNATILGITSSDRGSWLTGAATGLVAGPLLVLVGETVIKFIDDGLRRQYGIIACISPTFVFRLAFTLVPGFIARQISDAREEHHDAPDGRPHEVRQPSHELCPFAGRIVADVETEVLGFKWDKSEDVFRITLDWKIYRGVRVWGWIDRDGYFHQDPTIGDGGVVNLDATLSSPRVARLLNQKLHFGDQEVGVLLPAAPSR